PHRRPTRARARHRPTPRRRVHPVRARGRLPEDHALDARPARCRARDLPRVRVRVRRPPAGQELRQAPGRRNVGADAVIALALAAAIAVSVDARSVQPGELVVLTITLSDAREAVHVRAFDHEVPVYARPSTSSGRAKTPSTGLGRAE